MKKIVGKVHLWLGLTSGLVVFVISVTGCILAFEQEFKSMLFPYLHAEVQEGKEPLAPSRLIAIAGKHITDKAPNGVSYPGPGRSASVMYYGADPDYYYQVFMDPYSGKVLKVWSEEEDFFHFILHGHFYLWLPPKIGQPVVASATLVFLLMLISGLVLWWPKNKGAAKQRFSIKWNARWRRKNYDLHNVLGFYVMIIAMVLALTGLVWGFEWFSNATYYATTGKSLKDVKIPVSDTTGYTTEAARVMAVDRAWAGIQQQMPETAGMFVYTPQTKAEALNVFVNLRPGTYYKGDNYTFDQYTLQPLQATGPYSGKYADAGVGDKLRKMNYDIHTGAIWGLAGKIMMFCASLICASLPITGTMIWLGRKKKQKQQQRYAPVAGVRPEPVLS